MSARHVLTPEESKKGGKKNAWRQCMYCGRFVSYADLESGAAKRFSDIPSWDYGRDDVVFNDETYHVKCEEEA